MDRRTFLKTLASLGISVSVPPDLFAASPADIEAAWKKASEAWDLFEVSEYGTLSYANFVSPVTRREAYCLAEASRLTTDDIDACSPLASHVGLLYADSMTAMGTPLDDDVDYTCAWYEWFEGADEHTRAMIVRSINAWLDEPPDWSEEWEFMPASANAQTAAYHCMLGIDRDVLEALSIAIIQGEHPGSSYFAAELHMDPDAANKIAEAKGIAMRFVRDGAT